MKESHMQTMFTRYIVNNPPDDTEVYELKICKGTSLPFNRVADHQISALCRVESIGGCYWKIPDMAAINGYAAKKPYDCQFINKGKAYIVVWFYKPRKKKVFYKIRIGDWLHMKSSFKRKSVNEEMCMNAAEQLILIS